MNATDHDGISALKTIISKAPTAMEEYKNKLDTGIIVSNDETKTELEELKELRARENATNKAIEDDLKQVKTTLYSGGGALGFIVVVFIVLFIWCMCSNRGTIRHPCMC